MDEKGNIIQQADMGSMREQIWSAGINDQETRKTISGAWSTYNLMLEPHGAVGWAGLMKYFGNHPEDHTAGQLAISLETAHPAKFPKEINEILHIDPELPESLKGLETKPEHFTGMKNDYGIFKQFLKDNYR